jgi:hypothetical protein
MGQLPRIGIAAGPPSWREWREMYKPITLHIDDPQRFFHEVFALLRENGKHEAKFIALLHQWEAAVEMCPTSDNSGEKA